MADKNQNYSDIGFNEFLQKEADLDFPLGGISSSSGGGSISGEESTTEPTIKDGDTLTDLWITNIIASKNWKPRTTGFSINGQTGYAEFSDIYIKGGVEATTGTIGGFSLGTDYIKDSLDSFGLASTVTSGDDVRFWAGDTFANRSTAPARITESGIAYFTGAVIDGTSTIAGITGTQISYVSTLTADAVPTGLTCSSTTATIASDGSVSSSVVLTWTALATNTFDHYLIRYKKATNTYYTYIPSTINTITIEGLVPNISYNFGLASVNKFGTVSAYSSDISQTTATSTTAPATVVVNSATAGIQYVIIEWTHSASTDLASYNIYRKTTDDSSTSTLIGNCRTNYFIDGGKTGGQIYYYWVKAINTSGLESANYSTTVSATPRNVTSDDIVTIAGSKVLIDGLVYLSNWQHGSDLTKIDGGDIYTGSVTTTQLNFTPVQSTDVIAKINASAEGITIDADNLTIGATTTFSAGYDPTGKIAAGGAATDVNNNVTTISGGKITATSITADRMNVSTLSAIAADLGTITAGSLNINSGIASISSAGAAVFKSVQVGGSSVQYSLNDYGLFSFGDGSDGALSISGSVTLTADKYYTNLTINNGHTFNPAGYRVFCT